MHPQIKIISTFRSRYLKPFRMDLFGVAHGWGRQKGSPTQNLSNKSYNDKTWHSYTLPKRDPKIDRSSDTPFDFCWHHNNPTEIRKFCSINKYIYRLPFNDNF